jgi:hypothetical protein
MTLVLCLRRLGWSGLTLCSRVSKSERCNNCKGMLSVKGKVALAAVGMFLTIGVMGWIEGASADQPTPDYYIALGDSVAAGQGARVVQNRNKARVRTSEGVRFAGWPAGFLPESKARLGLGSKVRKSSGRQNRVVSLSLKSRCDNIGKASQVFP